jgi:hypothetical protein
MDPTRARAAQGVGRLAVVLASMIEESGVFGPMIYRALLLLLLAALLAPDARAADDADAARSPGRYTFSWPLDAEAPAPRGGTTRGPQVILDSRPSAAWRSLQEDGVAPFERDRRAILAMAGEYRVTFDFLEATPFGDAPRQAPYQSWATEKIYVDSDQGEAISLVHILEMRTVSPDGSVSEPMVTKHWRQDWRYQPTHIVEYRGGDRWERRVLEPMRTQGVWLQSVYQVDESPRYASTGRWEHNASFSTWLSEDTWRPLPRREWSVRNDYHVLIGSNRHTITPQGWLQEENNLKGVLTDERRLDPDRPYLAREYGVVRYERLRDHDFAAADRYYRRTREFWNQVRDRWLRLFAERGSVTLRGPVDRLGLFAPLFARADEIVQQDVRGAAAREQNAKAIERALREMGVEGLEDVKQ